MLFHTFGASGIIKREAQPPHLPHLVATRSQHTFTHTIQGVRTMDTLLLNTRTRRQQPTGIQNQKNSEQNAHYLLTTFFGCRARRADASRVPSLKEDSTMRYL